MQNGKNFLNCKKSIFLSKYGDILIIDIPLHWRGAEGGVVAF
jgi:hypothetical protein